MCLNECDEVVECDLIVVREYKIEVGRMRKIGENGNMDLVNL